MDRQQLIDLILDRATLDWLQAHEVAEIVKFDGGQSGLEQIRDISVSIIGELLRNGLIVCGDVSKDGFSIWPLSAESSIDKIEKSWRKVVEPNLGDVCWISLTNAGWTNCGK